MKQSERDELLIRLSERSANIWHTVEKIERHAADQNGFIKDNIIATSRNTVWRKVIVGIGSTGITALILHLIGVY